MELVERKHQGYDFPAKDSHILSEYFTISALDGGYTTNMSLLV